MESSGWVAALGDFGVGKETERDEDWAKDEGKSVFTKVGWLQTWASATRNGTKRKKGG